MSYQVENDFFKNGDTFKKTSNAQEYFNTQSYLTNQQELKCQSLICPNGCMHAQVLPVLQQVLPLLPQLCGVCVVHAQVEEL